MGAHSEGLSTAEVFIPALNKSCSLPNMKAPRTSHTQNEFLTCGGGTPEEEFLHTPHTCEVYNPLTASWSLEPYNLTDNIYIHNSWSLGNGSVLLLGGGNRDNKTEMVTQGIGSTKSFNLQQPCGETTTL